MDTKPQTPTPASVALVAGAVAGMAVDTAFFPLDTIKTRLQSKRGFIASGGFNTLFAGLSSAILGSAPGASAFFVTYETLKKTLHTTLPSSYRYDPLIHMTAASGGEMAACIIRVPTEVIKQRMQAGQYTSIKSAFKHIYTTEGIKGFYRGYAMTIFREIPFTCVQFPLYEYLKRSSEAKTNSKPSLLQSAFFGSISGGIAAAVTTPLDVIKTRIMLSQNTGTDTYTHIGTSFRKVIAEEGVSALFKGIGPRVMWISMGGAVFLGSYEVVSGCLKM